jgi:hypothetical protein
MEQTASLFEQIAHFKPPRLNWDDINLIEHFTANRELRHEFITLYAFSYPSRKAIRHIVDFIRDDKVLEVCAGLGFWAALLKEKGVDIICTDIGAQDGVIHSGYPSNGRQPFVEVEGLSVQDAIAKYSEHNVLMLSWPPYDKSVGADAVRAFGGNKVVYIGELAGGCCGDHEMFELLKDRYGKGRHVQIPHWFGLHDAVLLFERSAKE